MNQQCKVCGEPAAGFHFGAFTCEGCKSFFGRTYNNLSSISECKNNGECVINKKNRTACKACRLRKCLVLSKRFRASSADPDESANNPFAAANNTARTTISPKVEVPEVTLTKISPKTPSRRTPSTSSSSTTTTSDTYRPLLDRMSPYQLPTPFRPEPTPYFPIPFAIPPVSLALIANKHHHQLNANHEQHEPIDLSMKSKSSSGSGSPNRMGSPLLPADVSGAGDDGEDLSSIAAESAPRPVPLDLTFVRTKAMSG
ncbi:hypothetical protein quinque_007629 [Culex quinquefasciatus]